MYTPPRILLLLSFLFGSLYAQKKATILDHKDRIRISAVSVLNSRLRETNLSITPKGDKIFFMTTRGEQEWSNPMLMYKGQQMYDGDVWYSKKVNEKWQKPQCLPFGINTSSGEDEPNVSPDGKTVIFQSWQPLWQFEGGPYYSTTFNGTYWSKPKGLGGGIAQFFAETGLNATDGMSVSPDGKLFIVAAGGDYDGAMDIYISRKSNSGWSYLKKLGISTSGDERSAFIAADGKTLYFASNAYSGFGGLDIFKVEIKTDGTFGEVINIGAPFNTSRDDYGFILTGDGNEAYFVRDGDIYFADLTEADDRIKPQVEVLLSGTIKDIDSKKAIAAEVEIIDLATQKTVKTIKVAKNGKYNYALPNASKQYAIRAKSENYNQAEKSLQVDESAFSHAYEVNLSLKKNSPPPVVADSIPPSTPPTPPKPTIPDVEVLTVSPVTEYIQVNPIPVPTDVATSPIDEDLYSFENTAQNNLILLLDVSGSMNSADRLPLLKQSFKKMLTYMRPEDQITVIAYAGNVAVPIKAVSASKVEEISKALDKLGSGGGTKAKIALRKALKIAESAYVEGGNNRIILATDGDFEIEDLYHDASRVAQKNMFLSVFAFGKPSKRTEDRLRGVSSRGNGNFARINAENVDETLVNEAKAVRKWK